jgi:hypothetical protein
MVAGADPNAAGVEPMASSPGHAHHRVGRVALGVCALVACHSEAPGEITWANDAGPGSAHAMNLGPDPKRPEFCERQGADIVRDVFCAAAPPAIHSLRDLQSALKLLPPSWASSGATDGADSDRSAKYFVALGHSTALAGRFVSPINPRLFLIGSAATLTFQRGVERVELVALARGKYANDLYLLSFKRPCDETPDGCSPGERYTARIESRRAARARSATRHAGRRKAVSQSRHQGSGWRSAYPERFDST